MLRAIKYYWSGNERARFTLAWCDEFFADDSKFVWGPMPTRRDSRTTRRTSEAPVLAGKVGSTMEKGRGAMNISDTGNEERVKAADCKRIMTKVELGQYLNALKIGQKLLVNETELAHAFGSFFFAGETIRDIGRFAGMRGCELLYDSGESLRFQRVQKGPLHRPY